MIAKGAPQKKICVPDVAAAATWTHGELITGTGAQLNPYAAIVEPETGKVDLPPHAAISYAACAAEVEVDDETGEVRVDAPLAVLRRRPRDQPDARRGPDPGRRADGPRPGACSRSATPTTRAPSTAAREFGSYLAPGIEGLPKIDTIIIENPSADGPYGAKGISEMANNPQPPAIAAAVYDAVGVWVTELPITPERVLRALEQKDAGPAARRQVGDLRRGHLRQHGRRRGLALPLPRRCLTASRFGTWNGVEPLASSARRRTSTRSAASRCSSAA